VQAFFLDQDKPNQGRKVKSWRPRQKESAQESQPVAWVERSETRLFQWVSDLALNPSYHYMASWQLP
jgi:hypothetical protein